MSGFPIPQPDQQGGDAADQNDIQALAQRVSVLEQKVKALEGEDKSEMGGMPKMGMAKKPPVMSGKPSFFGG